MSKDNDTFLQKVDKSSDFIRISILHADDQQCLQTLESFNEWEWIYELEGQRGLGIACTYKTRIDDEEYTQERIDRLCGILKHFLL